MSNVEKPFVLLDKALFAPPGEGQTDPYFVQWQSGRGVYAGNGAVICQLFDADRVASSFAIFDAFNIARGPVATLRLKHPMPFGFHACFWPKVTA